MGGLALCAACLLRIVVVDESDDTVLDDESLDTTPSLEEWAYRAGGLEILGQLGEGGMGVVFEADEPALDRRVALKLLKNEYLNDPTVRRQFVEEARVYGRLQHPGMVPVYAAGELNGRPYFTMRLVVGRTFAERLRKGADPSWAIDVFLQICQALAYVHDRGIVHRDIKPSNVMVGDFGEVQIVDWGLAQTIAAVGGDGASGLVTAVMGTPAYMGPEQAAGGPTAFDRRVDVFGLGATLCEILTGAPPYRGASREEVVRKARAGDLDDALERIDATSAEPDLKALARDCLARDPAGRPRDAGVVAARVLEHRARVQSRLKEAEEARFRATVRATEERRRWLLALALLAVIGVAGFGWYARRAEQAREADATSRAVAEAIDAAGRLRERGRAGDALAEFRKAEGLLLSGPSMVREHFARPMADLAMLVRLDEIRYFPAQLGPGRLLPAESSAAYDSAFRDYGLDVPAGPDSEVAAAIRSSTIRDELVAALDDWARITPDLQAKTRLHGVSEAADAAPDGPAGRLRKALARSDRAALQELARSVVDADAAATVLASLGVALRDQRAAPASSEVLRAARRAHPDDFWINLELSTTLMLLGPDHAGEALAYRTAALALSRDNPAVHFYQASALQGLGRFDDAAASYREAIALRPDYPEAYCNLGNTLTRLRKLDEAEAAFREAIRLRPDYALAYFNLGYALDERGQYVEAFNAYGEASRYREGYAEALCNQGYAAYRIGRFADAIPPFERGLAAMKDDDPRQKTFVGMLALSRSLNALEPRLAGPLDDETLAHLDVDTLLGLARLCAWPHRTRLNDAVRLYEQAFTRDPSRAEDLVAGDRYAAAGVAAQAGSTPDIEQTRPRQLALGWLRADLDARRSQLEEADEATRRDILGRLNYWTRDPNLAGVREVERLPEAERAGWQALWNDHAKLASGP